MKTTCQLFRWFPGHNYTCASDKFTAFISPLIVWSLCLFEFWSILENSSHKPEPHAQGTVFSVTPFLCMFENMADERWKYYFFIQANSKGAFWKARGKAGLCQAIPKETRSLKSYFTFYRHLFDTIWDVFIDFHWFLIALYRGRVSLTLNAGNTLPWLWAEHVYSPAWCLNFFMLFPVPTEWKVETVPVAIYYSCLFNSYFLYDMSLAFVFCLAFLYRKKTLV